MVAPVSLLGMCTAGRWAVLRGNDCGSAGHCFAELVLGRTLSIAVGVAAGCRRSVAERVRALAATSFVIVELPSLDEVALAVEDERRVTAGAVQRRMSAAADRIETAAWMLDLRTASRTAAMHARAAV